MIFGPAFKLDIIPLQQEYSYEEPIKYKVILEVKKDKEIKQLKTRLDVYVKGRTICVYEEIEDGEEQEYTREEPFFFVYTLHEETLLEKTKPGKGKHEFTIEVPPPEGMPAPGNYKLFLVEWKARAEMPGFIRKTKAEKVINVKRPSSPGPLNEVNASGDELIVRAKIPKYIPLGGAFKAELELHPRGNELECKELKLELVNKVKIYYRDIDPTAKQCDEPRHEETYKTLELAKDLKITGADPYITTIELEIPEHGYPSFKHHDSGSHWNLVLVCKKGIMRSTKVEIPITVV